MLHSMFVYKHRAWFTPFDLCPKFPDSQSFAIVRFCCAVLRGFVGYSVWFWLQRIWQSLVFLWVWFQVNVGLPSLVMWLPVDFSCGTNMPGLWRCACSNSFQTVSSLVSFCRSSVGWFWCLVPRLLLLVLTLTRLSLSISGSFDFVSGSVPRTPWFGHTQII